MRAWRFGRRRQPPNDNEETLDMDTVRRRKEVAGQAVDQQRDAEDGLYRERAASDRMRMPHERDESAVTATTGSKAPAQEEVIGQAADDLARGLRDTDCRGQPRGERSPCPSPDAAPRPRPRGHSAAVASPARLGRAARRMRRPGVR
jgi:hypothetical protein